MAMPADVTFVQLTGTALDGTGAPVNTDPTIGPASFMVVSPMLPSRFSDIASNTLIMPQRQIVNFATGGLVPPGTQVIATDCPALAGISGFQYAVSFLLWDSTGGQLAPYSIILTAPTGTGPINLFSPALAVYGSGVGVPAM